MVGAIKEVNMYNLEELILLLKQYSSGLKFNKLMNEQYFVDTGLFFMKTTNGLPIYLVNNNGKTYFADYGKTFSDLEIHFEKLDKQTQVLIRNRLKRIGVIFDGLTLKFEVFQGFEVGALNAMISAMLFIEMLV